MEKLWKKWQIYKCTDSAEEIHTVVCRFFETFPRFFDGKRYKLINFAPKTEIVDNNAIMPKVSRLQSTARVQNAEPQRDKLSGKKTGRKF